MRITDAAVLTKSKICQHLQSGCSMRCTEVLEVCGLVFATRDSWGFGWTLVREGVYEKSANSRGNLRFGLFGLSNPKGLD